MADLKKLYIPDASVILKWIFDEKYTIQALKIKTDFLEGKIYLGIPSHCYSEIMNILGLKAPGLAILFLSQLQALQIEEYKLSLAIADRAIEIMQNFSKIAFYDASYHSTAIENNGTFITADENYYKKTKSLKSIKLLKDY